MACAHKSSTSTSYFLNFVLSQISQKCLYHIVYILVFQKHQFLFSPGVTASVRSPESPSQMLYSPLSIGEIGSERDEQTKRGRPPANAIQTLISQGSVTDSSIRCRFCSRVFPREKSLQAHMRTHTGYCYILLYITVSSVLIDKQCLGGDDCLEEDYLYSSVLYCAPQLCPLSNVASSSHAH